MMAYTDASYACSMSDGKFHFKFLYILLWEPCCLENKQNYSGSTKCLEIRSMEQGNCRLLWMNIVLNDFRIKYEGPIYEVVPGNMLGINITHNHV